MTGRKKDSPGGSGGSPWGNNVQEKKQFPSREGLDPIFKDLAPPDTDPKDEAILKMLRDGKKYREIVKELGVSQSRIAGVAANAGLLGEQRKREEVKKALLLFDDEFIGSVIEVPFDVLSKRLGEHWKLSPDEKKKLASLANKVSSKYIPLWLERYADEISLALAFGTAIYPRYLLTKELAQKQKEVEKPVPTLQSEQPSNEK